MFDADRIGSAPVAPAGTPLSVQWYVMYLRAGQVAPSPDQIGQSVLQDQIFHNDQFSFPAQIANPNSVGPRSVVIRLNLRVPKLYNQLAKDDQIIFVFKANKADDWIFNATFLFKEYYGV